MHCFFAAHSRVVENKQEKISTRSDQINKHTYIHTYIHSLSKDRFFIHRIGKIFQAKVFPGTGDTDSMEKTFELGLNILRKRQAYE